jgi:hypothetical protein
MASTLQHYDVWKPVSYEAIKGEVLKQNFERLAMSLSSTVLLVINTILSPPVQPSLKSC